MGFASRGVTSAEILAAIIDDSTRFSGADIATIEAKPGGSIEIWGAPVAPFSIANAASDHTLGNIVIPNVTGATFRHAYAMLHIATIYETSGGNNGLNLNTNIQVDQAAAGWTNAIPILANSIEIAANSRIPGGTWFMGNADVVARVVNNATTNVRGYQMRSSAGNLWLCGVQAGVKVIF